MRYIFLLAILVSCGNRTPSNVEVDEPELESVEVIDESAIEDLQMQITNNANLIAELEEDLSLGEGENQDDILALKKEIDDIKSSNDSLLSELKELQTQKDSHDDSRKDARAKSKGEDSSHESDLY